jgi:MarR-like DNA-binding transcriptional regulator SgrR of sgrS sRNA
MNVAALKVLLVVSLSFGLVVDGFAAGRKPYGGELILPMRHFVGVHAPQHAVDVSGRLGAELAHCRLMRRVSDGTIAGNLAESWTYRQGKKSLVMEVRLRRGGTFHNGVSIAAKHVVRSLRKYQTLGRNAWVKEHVRELAFKELDPRTVRVTAPTRRGRIAATKRIVEELLARPELSVVHTSRRRAITTGCGPFKPEVREGTSILLKAFKGHPLGRPWLEQIRLRTFSDPLKEVKLFTHQKLDMTFVGSDELANTPAESLKGYTTLFLIPAPYLRIDRHAGLRRRIYQQLMRKHLGKDIESYGISSRANGLWPEALTPSRMRPPTAKPTTLEGPITVAYPRADSELRRVAATVRDVLRESFSGVEVSSPPAEGLTLEYAVTASRPAWDFAVVLLDWSAHTPEQAAAEAKTKLQLAGNLRPKSFYTADVTNWAKKQNNRLVAIPLLHIERKLHHSGRTTFVPAIDVPRLSDSWMVP